MRTINFRNFFLFSVIVCAGVSAAQNCFAEQAQGEQDVLIEQLTYAESQQTELAAGEVFPLQVTISRTRRLKPGQSIFINFFLLPYTAKEHTAATAADADATFIGSADFGGLTSRRQTKQLSIELAHHIALPAGDYLLYSQVNLNAGFSATAQSRASAVKALQLKKSSLIPSLPVSLKAESAPRVELLDFRLKRSSFSLDQRDLRIEAIVGLQALGSDLEQSEISLCLELPTSEDCQPLTIWDSSRQEHLSLLLIHNLSQSAVKSTFVSAILSEQFLGQIEELTAGLKKTEFIRATLRARVSSSELNSASEKTVEVRFFPGLRKNTANGTSSSFLTDPWNQSGFAYAAATATPTPHLPSAPPSNRFNDTERPWNKSIIVPAIPARFVPGTVWTEQQYKDCLRYYCQIRRLGDENPSCEQASCGLSRLDYRFGSVANTIVGDGTLREYGFSNRGFGSELVLSGNSRVFRNPIVGDYVGGSVRGSAALEVQLFDAELTLASIRANAAIDTSTLDQSLGEVVFRAFGVPVLVKEQKIYPAGIEYEVSYFAGKRWSKEVQLGAAKGELSAEAGGSVGVGANLSAGLAGLQFSAGPKFSIGASTRIKGGFGIVASIGLEGGFTLITDSLTHTSTLVVNLNRNARTVSPSLNMAIQNKIDGPGGFLRLFGTIVGVKWRKTIVDWSTYSRTDILYNNNRSLGIYAY